MSDLEKSWLALLDNAEDWLSTSMAEQSRLAVAGLSKDPSNVSWLSILAQWPATGGASFARSIGQLLA